MKMRWMLRFMDSGQAKARLVILFTVTLASEMTDKGTTAQPDKTPSLPHQSGTSIQVSKGRRQERVPAGTRNWPRRGGGG